MKKNWKFFTLLAVALCGCALCPSPARAQFIGFTSPQTVQQLLANQVACTGAAQDFTISNLGQTEHSFTVLTGGSISSFVAIVYGVDVLGNLTQISDAAWAATGSLVPTTIVGIGYYPNVKIRVLCSGIPPGPSVFTISYSGVTSTPTFNVGSQLKTQLYKSLFSGLGAGASASAVFLTPFGNSGSTVTFSYQGGAGPANSTLSFSCPETLNTVAIAGSPYALDTAAGPQVFSIPALPCSTIEVDYAAGGANANTFNLVQQFSEPGTFSEQLGVPTHITGTTATVIKNGGGILTSLNVNTAAAGTVSVFDLASAACTGTPSTNVVAVITVNATDPAYSKILNTGFRRGICVKASAVMDLTVAAQ